LRGHPELRQGLSKYARSEGRMRITTCYSTGRTETTVIRGLDGDERRIILCCPWGELPIHTYVKIRHQLTQEEIRAVREAFGWEMEPAP
jgi:hypothetical protein